MRPVEDMYPINVPPDFRPTVPGSRAPSGLSVPRSAGPSQIMIRWWDTRNCNDQFWLTVLTSEWRVDCWLRLRCRSFAAESETSLQLLPCSIVFCSRGLRNIAACPTSLRWLPIFLVLAGVRVSPVSVYIFVSLIILINLQTIQTIEMAWNIRQGILLKRSAILSHCSVEFTSICQFCKYYGPPKDIFVYFFSLVSSSRFTPRARTPREERHIWSKWDQCNIEDQPTDRPTTDLCSWKSLPGRTSNGHISITVLDRHMVTYGPPIGSRRLGVEWSRNR